MQVVTNSVRIMKRPTIIGALIGVALSFNGDGQTLSGLITDEHGVPVAGATLVIRRLGQPVANVSGKKGTPELDTGASVSVIADQNASVPLQRLIPGRYDVCAYGPTKYYVSECSRVGTPLVDLYSGASLNISPHALHTASNLTIYVQDKKSKVSFDTLTTRAVHSNRLQLSVIYKSGVSVPAQAIAHSSYMHVFEVSIPTQEPISLAIDSDLLVTDLGGHIIETNKVSKRKLFSGGSREMSFSLVVN